MWKALRDIQRLSLRVSGQIIAAPEGQPHQRNKEDRRENENAVHHFLLREEMHEISRDQERLDRRNEQGDRDRQRHAAEVHVVHGHRQDGADEQGSENDQIGSDVSRDVVIMIIAAMGVRSRSAMLAHK